MIKDLELEESGAAARPSPKLDPEHESSAHPGDQHLLRRDLSVRIAEPVAAVAPEIEVSIPLVVVAEAPLPPVPGSAERKSPPGKGKSHNALSHARFASGAQG